MPGDISSTFIIFNNGFACKIKFGKKNPKVWNIAYKIAETKCQNHYGYECHVRLTGCENILSDAHCLYQLFETTNILIWNEMWTFPGTFVTGLLVFKCDYWHYEKHVNCV